MCLQLASGLGGPRAAAAVAPGVYGAAAGAGGVGAGVPLLPRRLAPAVDRLSHLLAQGYLYGVQGVAHLRQVRRFCSTYKEGILRLCLIGLQYDEEHRLSQRIRVVAEQAATGAADLNRRYRIIPTLQATYEMVSHRLTFLTHLHCAILCRRPHKLRSSTVVTKYAQMWRPVLHIYCSRSVTILCVVM